jgi:hypothetical protein
VKNKEKALKPIVPVGWVEVMSFDPRTGTGRAAICSYDKEGRLVNVTHEFLDAGGVMRWDDDSRSIPLIDRYKEVRAQVIAKCPGDYPLRSLLLVGKNMAVGRVKRLQHDSAARLLTYLDKHEAELQEIFKEPVETARAQP